MWRYGVKKILKFLLSRTFLFGLLIACQVGLFAALMLVFSRAGTVAYIILTLVSVLVVIAVIERDNINPAYKIMWLLIVVALPVTGAVFYLWWGNQGVTPKNARKFADIERAASAAMVQDDAVTEALYAREPAFRRSVEYLSRNASAPLYCNTQSEYYPMGQDFFARFLEVIRGAKKYIFMEYFIVEEGEMWNETLAVLKEKAAAGVDVRLIYDGFGSMFTLPGDYDEELCGRVHQPQATLRRVEGYGPDAERAGRLSAYRNIFENVGLCGGHHHPVHRLYAPGRIRSGRLCAALL